MVFSVSEVKTLTVERHSLWPVKSRFIKTAVERTRSAGPNRFQKCAVKFGYDEPVVIRVGDEQAIAFRVGQHLSGKRERQIANLRAFERQFQRLFVQFAALAKIVDGLGDHLINQLVVTFAGNGADNVAARIDQHLGGPGAHTVALPNLVVGVVVNRVLQFIAQDDAPDVFRVFLIFKFRRVYADNHELIGILVLQALQIGNDVNAVDAAVGPKIE